MDMLLSSWTGISINFFSFLSCHKLMVNKVSTIDYMFSFVILVLLLFWLLMLYHLLVY